MNKEKIETEIDQDAIGTELQSLRAVGDPEITLVPSSNEHGHSLYKASIRILLPNGNRLTLEGALCDDSQMALLEVLATANAVLEKEALRRGIK